MVATDDFNKRFWPKVILDGPIHRPELGPCWIWTASLNHAGYGWFWYDGRARLAHRVAYEALIGPIPAGLEPDHLCWTPACVNPHHLEPVTRAENAKRGNTGLIPGALVAARMRAKTHCPQGHEYSGDNLYLSPKGYRSCRTCTAESLRRSRQRRREMARSSGATTDCTQNVVARG